MRVLSALSMFFCGYLVVPILAPVVVFAVSPVQIQFPERVEYGRGDWKHDRSTSWADEEWWEAKRGHGKSVEAHAPFMYCCEGSVAGSGRSDPFLALIKLNDPLQETGTGKYAKAGIRREPGCE